MQTGSPLTPETPKQLPNPIQKARVGKNDARYWLPRLYRPVNSKGIQSPHYAMQLQFKGHRLGFGLHTSNREAAARRAAGIYGDLLSLGVEETLAKHRARRPEAEGIATVGEYLRAARGVMAVRPASFAAYASHLRRITGDIIGKRSPRKARSGRSGERGKPSRILRSLLSPPRHCRRGALRSCPVPGEMAQRPDRRESHATASSGRPGVCSRRRSSSSSEHCGCRTHYPLRAWNSSPGNP